MANSADPDQLASSEANWSGSTLFAKKGISGFSRTRVKGFDRKFMHIVSFGDYLHEKFQSLFSWKKKEENINLSFAENAHRVVKVKG